MNSPGMTEVLFSLVLVVISFAISRFWKIEVEKDIIDNYQWVNPNWEISDLRKQNNV